MALIIRLLSTGQANAGASQTLYQVPTTGGVLGAIVNNVRLVNSGGTAGTFNLFFTPSGGTSTSVVTKNQAIFNNKLHLLKPDFTMAPGDKLHVVPTASALEFVVSGVEQT